MLKLQTHIFMVLLVGCGTQLSCSLSAYAGELGEIRSSVEGSDSSRSDEDEDPPRRKRRRRRSHHHHDDDDSSDFFTELIGPPVFFAVSAPWWGPAAFVGDSYDRQAALPSYPYQNKHVGYLNFVDDYPHEDPFGFRLTSEYGSNFSGLQRYGGRLQLESAGRFGFDTEWNHWREDLPVGTDTLWLGDANLTFRFAQSERAQFYTGLGMNWMASGGGEMGFNFTYGFDWFPTEPFVIRSVLDMGTLGDADLYHNKTTIGLNYRNLEIFTGYDIIHIGDSTLQGVVGGLVLWF